MGLPCSFSTISACAENNFDARRLAVHCQVCCLLLVAAAVLDFNLTVFFSSQFPFIIPLQNQGGAPHKVRELLLLSLLSCNCSNDTVSFPSHSGLGQPLWTCLAMADYHWLLLLGSKRPCFHELIRKSLRQMKDQCLCKTDRKLTETELKAPVVVELC